MFASLAHHTLIFFHNLYQYHNQLHFKVMIIFIWVTIASSTNFGTQKSCLSVAIWFWNVVAKLYFAYRCCIDWHKFSITNEICYLFKSKNVLEMLISIGKLTDCAVIRDIQMLIKLRLNFFAGNWIFSVAAQLFNILSLNNIFIKIPLKKNKLTMILFIY